MARYPSEYCPHCHGTGRWYVWAERPPQPEEDQPLPRIWVSDDRPAGLKRYPMFCNCALGQRKAAAHNEGKPYYSHCLRRELYPIPIRDKFLAAYTAAQQKGT